MSEHGENPEDRIRKRAYALWEEDGRPEGREQDHWERASRDMQSEAGEADGASSQRADAETRQSENASVDQRTPAEATSATMRQESLGASRRSGAEPEAASRKPL